MEVLNATECSAFLSPIEKLQDNDLTGKIYNKNSDRYKYQITDVKEASKLYEMNDLILFHGTKEEHFVPNFEFQNPLNDYGSGLYTTPYEKMALIWSMSYYTKGAKGFSYCYRLDNWQDYKVLDFTKYDSMCWLAELVYNRPYNNLSPVAEDNKDKLLEKYKIDITDYDMIIGYRADDSYFTFALDFLSGVTYRCIFEEAIRLGHLGVQVCLKSKRIFENLEFIKKTTATPTDYKRFIQSDKDARLRYKELQRKKISGIKETIFDVLTN